MLSRRQAHGQPRTPLFQRLGVGKRVWPRPHRVPIVAIPGMAPEPATKSAFGPGLGRCDLSPIGAMADASSQVSTVLEPLIALLDPMMGVRVPGDGRRAAYRRALLPRLPAARPGRKPALEPGAASADDGRPHLRSGRLAEGARRNGQSVERRVRTLTALIRISPYLLTEILHPCGLAGGAVGDFGTGTFTSADFLSLLVDGMPIRLGDGDRRVSRPPLFSWPLFSASPDGFRPAQSPARGGCSYQLQRLSRPAPSWIFTG
ncbi:hypothetical protein SAMN04489717_0079 [Actinopolymorpha singaporensis]|uniref:Uncharacterized protein n=1 Tax=Actinopolymorpha singaporensis TaxID=117157 RepID=A0A1H1L4J1_9ACTN|nr:hypothetical protein SAMN04489717_0079 [Actinopolymorpha singaporensis]